MTSFNLMSVEPAKINRDPLPRGRYFTKIVKASWGTSSNGNPKGSLHLKVIKGQFEGKMVFVNVVATEKAMPFFRAYMEGMLGAEAFASFAKGCDSIEKVANKAKKLFEGGKLVDLELLASVRIVKDMKSGEPTNTVDALAQADEIEEEEEEDKDESDDE